LGLAALRLSPQRKNSLSTWNDALETLSRANANISNSFLHSSLYLELFRLRNGEPFRWVILFAVITMYGCFICFEGIGLWLDIRWIEKLTVISTSVFIPVEIWEILQQLNIWKLAALILNLVAVVWLYRNRWRAVTH
jgi:uncharacterized membrane protein (DUF2068 family)